MKETKEFTTEELVDNLDKIINAHRNDPVSPFETDWVGILVLARTKIIELDRDFRIALDAAEDLKDGLRMEQEKYIELSKKSQELDIM